jgi:hypothetical protein
MICKMINIKKKKIIILLIINKNNNNKDTKDIHYV